MSDYDPWGFSQDTFELSRDLDAMTRDAVRRVRQLSPRSQQLLDMLLDGCGKADIVARTGLTSSQVDKARSTMLAELDVPSTTDAIRVGICADYGQLKDRPGSSD